MTVMPGLRQFVSLVSKGGTPIMIADAFGNPYPTTGHGSLVFNEGAELFDPVLHGVVTVEDAIHLPSGTAAQPPLTFGPAPYNFGMYDAGISVGGLPIVTFQPDGISVIGNIGYSGELQGAYHTPMTTRGDLYYFGASGPARLPLGGAGNVLASNGADLVYVPPAAGGTLTAVSQVDGETVASPNPIIATGTIGLADTTVVPAVYGDATHIPQIVIDAKGRITTANNVPVTLGGTVTSITAGTGLAATPANPIVAAGTINLANTAVTPAVYGSATNIPQLTVDQQGRITLATNVAVSIPPAGVTSISQGTGITLTPNPLVSTGTIAVNTTVIATKTDLNSYLPLAGGTVIGTVIFQPSAPLAANTPAIDVRQTWNNVAVDFRAIAMNVTDTASGGGSRLVSLQVGGVDYFYIDKSGTSVTRGNTYAGGSVHANTGSGIPPAASLDSGLMMSTTPNFGVTFTTNVPTAAFAKGAMALANGGNGMPWVNYDGTGAGWARAASMVISDTAPASAPDDQLWWNTAAAAAGGQLMIRYNDGNTVQWVPAAPGATQSTTPGGDFMATHSSVFNLPSSWGPVTLNTVTLGNTGGYYSTSTGRWTPPAGRYNVVATLTGGNSGGPVDVGVAVYKNGVLVNYSSSTTGAASFGVAPEVDIIVDANGGDYFQVYGYTSPQTSTQINGRFSAFPLSGVKGPPGDPYPGTVGGDVCAYTGNIPGMSSGVTVVVTGYTVSSGNSGGWLNVTNGRLTLPAGRHQLTGMLSLYSAASLIIGQIALRKNGVLIPGSQFSATSPAANNMTECTTTAIVDANGTDYFELTAFGHVTPTASNSMLTAYPITGVKGPPGDPGPTGSALGLYQETILSTTATVIDVAFPANAKRVEIEFAVESSVSALIGFTLLQGGTQLVGWNGQFLYGTGASVASSVFSTQASVGIITGTVATGTTKVFKTGGAGGNINIIMNTYGAVSGAYVNQQAIANNPASFNTVTGARLILASGNFLAGSWMRSYVVT